MTYNHNYTNSVNNTTNDQTSSADKLSEKKESQMSNSNDRNNNNDNQSEVLTGDSIRRNGKRPMVYGLDGLTTNTDVSTSSVKHSDRKITPRTEICETEISKHNIYVYVPEENMPNPDGLYDMEEELESLDDEVWKYGGYFYSYCYQLPEHEMAKYFPKITGRVFNSSLMATGYTCYAFFHNPESTMQPDVVRYLFSDGHRMVIVLLENLRHFLLQHKDITIFCSSFDLINSIRTDSSMRSYDYSDNNISLCLCGWIFIKLFWRSLCTHLALSCTHTAVLLNIMCFTADDELWDKNIHTRQLDGSMSDQSAKYLPSLILAMLEQYPELSHE